MSLRDSLTVGGLLFIAGGAALIFPPAGLIVLGVEMTAAGVGLALLKGRPEK